MLPLAFSTDLRGLFCGFSMRRCRRVERSQSSAQVLQQGTQLRPLEGSIHYGTPVHERQRWVVYVAYIMGFNYGVLETHFASWWAAFFPPL